MNKIRTIKQLQLRLFVLFVLLFVATKVSYRFLVERPAIQATLETIIKDDIFEISSASKRTLQELEHFTYDFVNSSYFLPLLNKADQASLEAVVQDIIYKEIPAHAMLVLDENLEPVLTEPLNYGLELLVDFNWQDVKGEFNRPTLVNAQLIKPRRLGNYKSGIIKTSKGFSFFSSRSIRDSANKEIGFIILLRLIDDVFLDELGKETHTRLTLVDIPPGFDTKNMIDWREMRPFVEVTPVNQRIVKDIHETPIAILTVEHLNGVMPPWLGVRFIVFTLSFSLILLATNLFFTRRVSTPINSLSEEVKRMTRNEEFEHITARSKIIELNDFIDNFNALTAKVKEQTKLLNEQAFIDPLTQIANRRSFDIQLQNQLQLLSRHHISFCLIMADVDHFKRYNDSLGHQAGDTMLINIASFLRGFFKRNNDSCARFGGEEFVMIYSDVSYGFVEQRLTEMVKSLAAKQFPHPDSPTESFVTISLGACIVKSNDASAYEKIMAKDIILQADTALYQAKEQGRNRAVICEYTVKS